MSESLKRQAAKAAMNEIKSGQRLGLGTGSTARHFVELLGEAVSNGFECICVPTSEETAHQARELGIPLTDLDTISELDVTVDGADEIDPQLNLIKGGGGALLREKIVADASCVMIVIADGSKMVASLGDFPLPIEVNRFSLGATRRRLEQVLGDFKGQGEMKLRLLESGQPFVSDGGHLIFDAFFGRILDAKALSTALLEVPGVVQHGLFLGMCDTAFVATNDGVKRYDR